MLRRVLITGAVTTLALFGAASAGDAATGGALCQLAGTATFQPNGPGTTASFGYSLGATLSNCQSNLAGAPASGTIAVGHVVTATVPIVTSTGTVTGTAQYQEPLATGAGSLPANSCPAGSTAGTAVASWPDGTSTVVSYTTSSAGAAVNLQGTVVSGVTATLVAGSESVAGTAPSTYTIATTNTLLPVGTSAQGALTFTTSDPQDCTAASGLVSADVQGATGLGSPS